MPPIPAPGEAGAQCVDRVEAGDAVDGAVRGRRKGEVAPG